MNKPDIKKAFFLFVPAFLLAAALVSCEKADVGPEAAAIEPNAAAEAEVSASSGPAEEARETGAGREAILIRGNHWVPGVAGFGPNGISALSGEYRIDGPSPRPEGKTAGAFSVHLTREFLHFSEDWQNRPGTGDMRVFQREGEDGFLAAAMLDDGGSPWTAVFLFPGGLEKAGLESGELNVMLRAWTRRFSYFLSLARTPGELSLPAALEF